MTVAAPPPAPLLTPLAALLAALRRAGDHDPRAEAPPTALLWCDAGAEFLPVLPMLRRAMPHLLTLGAYDPALRQGPAIWLRVAAGGAAPGLTWEDGAVPVLYLPGVGRDALRDAEGCPEPLRLLAWYVPSGAVFGHPNARDWTLRGFLAAKREYGGLGLDVAGDEPARMALAAAAPRLFGLPLAELAGRRMDAAWLQSLLAPDLAADALAWLSGTLSQGADEARYAAFAARARTDLRLDPAKVSPAAAAARVLRQDGAWADVWTRFTQAGPGFHEAAAALLAAVDPPDPLLADPAVYASANAKEEAQLRASLVRLAPMDEAAARAAIAPLAAAHDRRRSSPWAMRGQAPLATAAHHLARLAAAAALPHGSADAMAAAYARDGWQADDAALRALEAVAPREGANIETLAADQAAVAAALRALHLPRLMRDAEAMQALLPHGPPAQPAAAPASPPASAGDAILFVDGLRMDLAHRLADLLVRAGAKVDVRWRWTGFPSVTATCKPLASPAAARFRGGDEAGAFEPLAADGRRATKPVLLRELAALGWSTSPAGGDAAPCWLEAGHFDRDGHGQQARMADSVAASLAAVAAQAAPLLRAGRRLRIVTDHGWLLLPGGLPVAALPAGLTDTLWRRCALVQAGAATTATRLPWTWNPAVAVASAPGAHVFGRTAEYAHGGISPQESVVPELLVSAAVPARRATIAIIEWSGLRLRVRAEGGDGLMADLRLGADGEGTSVVDRPRALDADGRTSLLVPDDRHAGVPARLELRDEAGQVAATAATVVGG